MRISFTCYAESMNPLTAQIHKAIHNFNSAFLSECAYYTSSSIYTKHKHHVVNFQTEFDLWEYKQ